MQNNNQRDGSKSNSHVGRLFEDLAMEYYKNKGIILEKDYAVDIGVGKVKKLHKFDLGKDKFVVECKSHKWTKGNYVPSAKMSVWNEVMYYFSVLPEDYKKVLFVLKDYSEMKKKTLARYYKDTYFHLRPKNVTIIEYDEKNKETKAL
ncbi:MAG: hypothetical protein KKD05_06470 [Candidatus Omnitrophica bacterium]|nr:hypothetical protein [Candidatus Omnitrophota bacterium]